MPISSEDKGPLLPVVSMQPKKDDTKRPVLSCLAYSFCSISMVLANKALLNKASFNFNFPTMLLIFQNLCGILFLSIGNKKKWFVVDALEWKKIKQWLPVSGFFLAMLLTSFMSLRDLAVPMVTIVKNLTNIGIVFGDKIFFKRDVSIGIVGSIALMTLGAVCGGYNDVSFSFRGYFWMIMNCVSTAGYVLYMSYATQSIKLTNWGRSYYNFVLSTPLVLPFALFMDWDFYEYESLYSFSFISMLTFSGIVGTILSLASFWCVRQTSSTTYSVVGALNKVPLVFLGAFFFNSDLSFKTLMFVSFGLAGGLWYGLEKDRMKKAAAALQNK